MQDPFALARDGDVEALRDLIEMDGFDINTVRWSGFTLLHRAAESGHTQLCEYLISQGSKVNLKTTWGWFTPCHLALGNGWKETAAYLIEAGGDGNAKNKDKQTPAEYAHVRGFRDLSRDFTSIVKAIEEAQSRAREHLRMKRLAAMAAEKNAKEVGAKTKKSLNESDRTISAIGEEERENAAQP